MKKIIVIIFTSLLFISTASTSNKVLLRFKFKQGEKLEWMIKGKAVHIDTNTKATYKIYVDLYCQKVIKQGKTAKYKGIVKKFLINKEPSPMPIPTRIFLMNNRGYILKRIENMRPQFRFRMQFPKHAVGPGDTWNNEAHVITGPYIYLVKVKAKFVKYLTYKGKKCILISQSGIEDKLKYVRSFYKVIVNSRYIVECATTKYLKGELNYKFYRKVDNKWLLKTLVHMEQVPIK